MVYDISKFQDPWCNDIGSILSMRGFQSRRGRRFFTVGSIPRMSKSSNQTFQTFTIWGWFPFYCVFGVQPNWGLIWSIHPNVICGINQGKLLSFFINNNEKSARRPEPKVYELSTTCFSFATGSFSVFSKCFHTRQISGDHARKLQYSWGRLYPQLDKSFV